MAKTIICPHCGGKKVKKVDTYLKCEECEKDFGRKALNDDGIPLTECIKDIRFRYGDVISGSVRAHFVEDDAQCVYEVYDANEGGVDKVADLMTKEEWETFKKELVEDIYLFDWNRVYIPVNDGRELRGNNEWELDILATEEEEYIFKGVDAYPVYWNKFLRLLEPYFDKLKK